MINKDHYKIDPIREVLKDDQVLWNDYYEYKKSCFNNFAEMAKKENMTIDELHNYFNDSAKEMFKK